MAYKNNGYATHQPIFIEILKNTTGNILECGCGEGSTIMLREQIQQTNRKLVSLESNMEWLNRYASLADASHQLYLVDANNEDTVETGNAWVQCIKERQLNDFEIVFLDSSPWSSRKSCFDYFLPRAKIILIHDFDYYPNHNLIGKTTNKQVSYYQGNIQERITCDLQGIVKNYKLFYPPRDYFMGATGPPTLVCSDRMETDEFQSLIDNIESQLSSYYAV